MLRGIIPAFLYSTPQENALETVFHEELEALKQNKAYRKGPLADVISNCHIYPEVDEDDECVDAIVKSLDCGSIATALKFARTTSESPNSLINILDFDSSVSSREREIICLALFEALLMRCWNQVLQPLLQKGYYNYLKEIRFSDNAVCLFALKQEVFAFRTLRPGLSPQLAPFFEPPIRY